MTVNPHMLFIYSLIQTAICNGLHDMSYGMNYGGSDHHMNRLPLNVKYIDLLCADIRDLHRDQIPVILGYIPAVDREIDLHDHGSFETYGRESCHTEAEEFLRKANHALDERNEVDSLTLYHLLRLFKIKFEEPLKENRHENGHSRCDEEYITTCATGIIELLDSSRFSRKIFLNWLKSYRSRLCELFPERSHDRDVFRLKSYYASYLRRAVEHIIRSMETPRLYDGSGKGFVQKFFVTIPQNNVTAGTVTTNVIIPADTFVDLTAVEK